MVVRLPNADCYAGQVEKEWRWLPQLAPLLPLVIPQPLALAKATSGFPRPWAVYRWIEGTTARAFSGAMSSATASVLGGFLAAVQRLPLQDGPTPGQHSFGRGGPLSAYDGEVGQALAKLRPFAKSDVAVEIWQQALESASSRTTWLHGDVAPANLILRGNRLVAVIDWGLCAVGDPSCDIAIAWSSFGPEARADFRYALAPDDATWARGRGWALWKALIVLAELAGTDPRQRQIAAQSLAQVLADW